MRIIKLNYVGNRFVRKSRGYNKNLYGLVRKGKPKTNVEQGCSKPFCVTSFL